MTITADEARKLLDGATPGPIVPIIDETGWSADFDEGDCAWITLGQEGGSVTALVVGKGLGGRRLDANAALYAAAPEAMQTIIDLTAELAEARAEVERLRLPSNAARLICDEVLQKHTPEARWMREVMVKATMTQKVPSLTNMVRWGFVNDALQALAALSRKGAANDPS